MRIPSKTPAVVLRSRSFGESDKIVSFLTKNYGKVTGIAKGAKRSRKRFVNSLEPFSLVSLRFQDNPYSSLVFIQSCDWIRIFKQITKNLGQITYASYLVEITEALKQTGNKLFVARGHGVYALGANLLEAWGHAATFEHSMRILYLSELADL